MLELKQLVRFCSTPAGRVAYSVIGRGPALVYLSGYVSHLEFAWTMPAYRRFVEALAEHHTVIRFDRVGCGLSDRVRADFGPQSELETLEALVQHLRLRKVILFGSCDGGMLAADFTARHPEQVSALVIYGSCARGDELAPPEVKTSILGLIRAHWGLGSRALADIWLPDASSEAAETFAAYQRAASDPEMAARLLEMYYRADVSTVLPQVSVPTLVMHRRRSRAANFELGRQVAALIPGARLVPLEGRMHAIYAEDEDVAYRTIVEFLNQVVPPPGQLTERELEVSELIAEGCTNAEIASTLRIALRTVDAHVEHIRTKLGVRSRAQIAVWTAARATATGGAG